jgi:hypothetical protein
MENGNTDTFPTLKQFIARSNTRISEDVNVCVK